MYKFDNVLVAKKAIEYLAQLVVADIIKTRSNVDFCGVFVFVSQINTSLNSGAYASALTIGEAAIAEK